MGHMTGYVSADNEAVAIAALEQEMKALKDDRAHVSKVQSQLEQASMRMEQEKAAWKRQQVQSCIDSPHVEPLLVLLTVVERQCGLCQFTHAKHLLLMGNKQACSRAALDLGRCNPCTSKSLTESIGMWRVHTLHLWLVYLWVLLCLACAHTCLLMHAVR